MRYRCEDRYIGDGSAPLLAAMELLEARLLLDGGPEISEFMASNGSTIADIDGDFPDWIEIHNDDTAEVNLDGWYLTDDADDPTKWRFPTTTVAADGYLLVFASDKDRAVAGEQLHTNFKLSADGEYLALVDPTGVVVSAYDPEFPPQIRDVSYGLGIPTTPTAYMEYGSDVRALVPTNSTLETTWMQRSFNDLLWEAGTLGVGYDDAATFDALIGLDVGMQMAGANETVYVRVPFTVDNPSDVLALSLEMQYNCRLP